MRIRGWSSDVCSADLLGKHDPGDLANELLELLVLGDEIGFRIDLDGGAGGAPDGDTDQPFGGGSARLLLRGRKALGAQPVDRGFHVAAAFGQRLLAIHHARAAAVTKLLHGGGGDLGHWVNSSYIVKWMRAGKGVRPTPRSEEHTSELQ